MFVWLCGLLKSCGVFSPFLAVLTGTITSHAVYSLRITTAPSLHAFNLHYSETVSTNFFRLSRIFFIMAFPVSTSSPRTSTLTVVQRH